MAKQPEFTKYRPLPKSATRLTTWWTNVQPKIQSHRTAWLNHGWVVQKFDLAARRVKFVGS